MMCTRCAIPTTTTLAGIPHCEPCREAIIGPIRTRRNADGRPDGLNGVGRALAPRPDYGPAWFDLECDTCSATFVGLVGVACAYCDGLRARMIAEQSVLLLRPDLPDPADRRYGDAVAAWAERLARGVDADLLGEDEARRAIARTEVRHAA